MRIHTVHRNDDGVDAFDDMAELLKSRFPGTSHWSMLGSTSWQKGYGEKCFSTDWTLNISNISNISRQWRDIQEELSKIQHRKTMYCCRMTSPIASTTSGTLTTCMPSSRVDWFREEEVSRGTGSPCLFTAVNPMYANQDQEEVQYDLDKPRIAVYKKHLENSPNNRRWCNLKLSQSKGLQFYQTRFDAIATFNTLLAICIEKRVHMKTGEDLYYKVFQSPRLPRVALTPKLHHERQDLSDLVARTSADHQNERSAKYEEHRRGNVDYRIQGIPHSTV